MPMASAGSPRPLLHVPTPLAPSSAEVKVSTSATAMPSIASSDKTMPPNKDDVSSSVNQSESNIQRMMSMWDPQKFAAQAQGADGTGPHSFKPVAVSHPRSFMSPLQGTAVIKTEGGGGGAAATGAPMTSYGVNYSSAGMPLPATAPVPLVNATVAEVKHEPIVIKPIIDKLDTDDKAGHIKSEDKSIADGRLGPVGSLPRSTANEIELRQEAMARMDHYQKSLYRDGAGLPPPSVHRAFANFNPLELEMQRRYGSGDAPSSLDASRPPLLHAGAHAVAAGERDRSVIMPTSSHAAAAAHHDAKLARDVSARADRLSSSPGPTLLPPSHFDRSANKSDLSPAAKDNFPPGMHNRGPFIAHRNTHSPLRDTRSPKARGLSPTHRLSPRVTAMSDVISPHSSRLLPAHLPSAAMNRDLHMTSLSSALSPTASSQSVGLKSNMPPHKAMTSSFGVLHPSAAGISSHALPHPPPLVSLPQTAVPSAQPPAVVASTHGSSVTSQHQPTQQQQQQRYGDPSLQRGQHTPRPPVTLSAASPMTGIKQEPGSEPMQSSTRPSRPASRSRSRSPLKREPASPQAVESDSDSEPPRSPEPEARVVNEELTRTKNAM